MRETPPVPATVVKPRQIPIVALLRPRQWIKNGFVLAPLIFASRLTDPQACMEALLATALFCAAASAVYVFNDFQDLEQDRLHPVKSQERPLAAGTVSRTEAILVLIGLYLLVFASNALPSGVGIVIDAYVLLNWAYSLSLKHVPVVDIFCVASGFVLRVTAGAVAIQVPLSSWMMITTLCLALYLAAVKRRQELVASGAATRGVLASYSPVLLDNYAQMAAMGAVIFYGLFAVTVRPGLAGTSALVLFGLFRYEYLVGTRGVGENPTNLVWTDAPLLLTVALWGLVCAYVLWP